MTNFTSSTSTSSTVETRKAPSEHPLVRVGQVATRIAVNATAIVGLACLCVHMTRCALR